MAVDIKKLLLQGSLIKNVGLILALGGNAAYIGGVVATAAGVIPIVGFGALLVAVGAGIDIAQALKK